MFEIICQRLKFYLYEIVHRPSKRNLVSTLIVAATQTSPLSKSLIQWRKRGEVEDVRSVEDAFVPREPSGAANLVVGGGGGGGEADTHEMTVEISLMASSGRPGSDQAVPGGFDGERGATDMLLHQLHEQIWCSSHSLVIFLLEF
ncbi:hypothetical protein Ddye_023724 [Dipteronia dyeriana]|uniref:Uncharacterized protein n=1 Tax=Dipteronia dyeriana TaxID=168575 RepID=A0AAD9TU46_9ROSI|nr:hypothetical protein Ddye_023724 [Dipteronia dyeriana]